MQGSGHSHCEEWVTSDVRVSMCDAIRGGQEKIPNKESDAERL